MDISTQYLGLDLKNPLVPSASPMMKSLDSVRKLEDAGAAAIIMHSLFEEEISHEHEEVMLLMEQQELSHGEGSHFIPTYEDYANGLDAYLEQIQRLKSTLEIPVIASLNGISLDGWIDNGRKLEEAGADALELNVYFITTDSNQSGAEVEDRYTSLLRELRENVSIPICMKLSSHFSSIPHLVKQLEINGAAGVTLFNCFYKPDISTDTLQVIPTPPSSSETDMLLRMRWIAILYSQVGLSLGVTGGVKNGNDALKFLLAGADVVQLCTILFEKGPEYLAQILTELKVKMEQLGFDSISELKGSISHNAVKDRQAFERAQYFRYLTVQGR
ncbi:MAG: dihydroorotate dehydrogenase-like protein [Arenicellales bacterium]|nr:dihydroorotate dehydrogenase-like protein [Arenicellales bacterium]